MCGIAGYVTGKDLNNLEISNNMIEVMKHRGPDTQGLELFTIGDKYLSLVHARLSIQDLSSHANQPFFNDEKSVALIFNGEIYNFLDLKQQLLKDGFHFKSTGDTEVLLNAYLKWGENIVEYVNGDFAFCIYDGRINKLFLFRDPIGIKPLYYYFFEDKFVFASEIKAIFQFPDIKKEINEDVLSEYLINGWVYEPDTMFKGIKKIEAGHFMVFDILNFKYEIFKYFKIEGVQNQNQDLDKLINIAIEYQTISDAPLGLYLSGGVDSSIIAAKLKIKDSIYTLTASMKPEELEFEGFEDDLKYARKVVNQYPKLDLNIVELNHTMINEYKRLVYFIEEPVADPAIVPAYLLAKQARDNGYKVMLSGMGADELFGGYPRYLAYQKISKLKFKTILSFLLMCIASIGQEFFKKGKFLKLFRDLQRISNGISKSFPFDYIYLMSYFSEKDIEKLAGKESLNKFYKKVLNIKIPSFFTLIQKLSYIDLKGFLASHNLIYMDKASMAASVECRVPLIDINIVKDVFYKPDKFKINEGNLKSGLKDIALESFDTKFVNRKKAGFSMPVKSWISKDIKEEVLNLKTGRITKYLNRNQIIKIVDQHYSGSCDNAMKIWNLYTLELWLNTFFDKSEEL